MEEPDNLPPARRSPPRPSRHHLHPSAAASGPPSDDWGHSSTLRSPSEGDQPVFDEVASSAALPDRDRDQYFPDDLDEKRGRGDRRSGFTELSIPDNRTAKNSNPAHYTFYREPTPPPVLYRGEDEDDGRIRGRGMGGAGAKEVGMTTLPSTSLGGSDDGSEERGERRVCCGASRRLCVVLLLAVAFLVVSIGLGLGLGLGLRSNVGAGGSAVNASGAESGGGGSSSSSATPSPTRTSSSPSSSSSSKTSSPTPSTSYTPRTDCPAANNTEYSPPGLSKKFLRICGVDYPDSGGAIDISKFPASNMGECMNACAATLGCTGCSWGIHDDDGGKHPCVLKKDLKTARQMDPDWCFATLL